MTLSHFSLFLLFVIPGIHAQDEEQEGPKFRILAPQFICPKDEDSDDNSNSVEESVICFQMAAGETANIEWTVRWRSHGILTQRSTLLLWRAVRALQAELDQVPPEPYTYVISNDELMPGIDYIFDVTALSSDGVRGQSAEFSIVYEDGKRTLDLQETVTQNKFSLLLLGSENSYAHVAYSLQAQVHTCKHTDDYKFAWNVKGVTDPAEEVDVSEQVGAYLLVPAGTFRGGHRYDISCELHRASDDQFITRAGIFVAVERRGLAVQFSLDELVVGRERPLHISAELYNYDNLPPPITLEWSCEVEGGETESCSSFESVDDDTIFLQNGFSEIGDYEIRLKATVGEETAEARMRVVVVKPSLPVIEVERSPRLLNEGTTVELVANVSNISPSCTLTWHFASDDTALTANNTNTNCSECEHGEPLGESLSIYSMDESFLSELADFSNASESREVRALLPAARGRARLLAACGCSDTYGCEAEGIAYADIDFTLNPSPVPSDLMVSPDGGVALETLFRLSTVAVFDLDPPVSYTFYYTFKDTVRVLLGSYIGHVAHENVLPYIEGGVAVGVEVCDVWGACGSSESLVHTSPGAGDVTAVARLTETTRAQLRRCELTQLASKAASALLTFTNTQQTEALDTYSSSLVQILKEGAGEACIQNHIEHYHALLDLLANAGLFDKHSRE